jgi:peptide/nickel transport system permease protein
MLIYLLKRLVAVIPTLLIVTVIAFLLSRLTPGDPVARLCGDTGPEDRQGYFNQREADRRYADCARLLGLDKPAFYFSVLPLAFPDTLFREIRTFRRRAARQLLRTYGNWPAVEGYRQAITEAVQKLPLQSQNNEGRDYVTQIRSRLLLLHVTGGAARAEYLIREIEALSASLAQISQDGMVKDSGEYAEAIVALRSAYGQMVQGRGRWKLLLPTLRWYGSDNQYHHWLSGVIRGNLGISYQDRKPVGEKILASARWTLLINSLAILGAFALAIPLGVWSASREGRRLDRVVSWVLFGLYSLPAFWVATLLILFVTTPEYGMWLDWFPSGGLGNASFGVGFLARALDVLWHITLPVLCLTYGSLALIARQMRGSMAEVLGRPFILTARAKGLREQAVVWRHAFRNALSPIITLIGSVVPALLAGSVIIEYIFSIPGMGQLTYQSIVAEDWPVVFGILLIASLLTMLGNLLADALYTISDPRVSFQKKGV